VHETLDRLVERGLVARHPRRPGQKEDRYEQLLGSVAVGEGETPPAELLVTELDLADALERADRDNGALWEAVRPELHSS